jgi:hypothetical protein
MQMRKNKKENEILKVYKGGKKREKRKVTPSKSLIRRWKSTRKL